MFGARIFAHSCLAAALAAGAGPPRAQAPATAPNILLIISDDHRWDALRAAGNSHIVTLHLDRLAEQGVHFIQATAHVPQCSPTRAELLTGLPSHRTGWYSNQFQRSDAASPAGLRQYRLLPDLLRRAGYQTALIGKWHLALEPWDAGFAEMPAWLPQGSGPYRDLPLANGRSRQRKPAAGYAQEVFASAAIDYIREARQPFFLWLAFTAPHGPHQPNPPHVERSYAGKTRDDLVPPGFSGEPIKRSWNDYYAAITFLDEQVGRVLAALKTRGADNNTVVVFLGDNGFMMGSRGWDGKVLPYEDSIRVPLIVRAPSLAGPRGRSSAAASSLDLPPTLLRLAGVQAPDDWPGRDLSPVLRGESRHGIDHAFSEFADNQSAQFGQYAYRLVRTPAHKLIRWERTDKPDELYDLAKDPRETTNVSGRPAYRDIEARLRKLLDK